MPALRRARCLAAVQAVLEPLEPRLLLSNLPAGFIDADIGSPSQTGTANYTASNNQWSLTGGGTGITGTSDQFNYAYENWNGGVAGSLIADVGTVSNTGSGAQAGIMFRDTTAANAQFVAVTVNSSHIINLEYRTSTGGSISEMSTSSAVNPSWVKLTETQSGSTDTFTAYYSTNGNSWTQLGSTVSLNSSNVNLAGLAVTSGSSSQTNTVTLSHVSANETLSGATLSQSTTVLPGSTLTVENGLTIDSGVTLTVDAGGTVDFVKTTGNSSQSLSGGGQIVLDAGSDGYSAAQLIVSPLDTVTLESGTTISGAGTESGSGTLINDSTLDANVSGQSLGIDGTLQNNGILEASSGGNLSLGYEVSLNSSGTVNIESGSSGYIAATNNAGTINVNGGTLSILTNPTQLYYETPDFTNASTGNINVTAGTLLIGGYNGQNFNNESGQSIFTNYGTIDATGGSISIAGYIDPYSGMSGPSISNAGTITAGSGSYISMTIESNYSGSISNSGTINVDGGYVILSAINSGNSTIINQSGGTLEANSGTLILNGNSTNDGTIDIESTVVIASGSGYTQITNNGTINVSGGYLGIFGYLGAVPANAPFSIFMNYGTIDATGGTISIAGYQTAACVSFNQGLFGTGFGEDAVGSGFAAIGNYGTIIVGSDASMGMYIEGSYAGYIALSGNINVQGNLTVISGDANYNYNYPSPQAGPYTGGWSGIVSYGTIEIGGTIDVNGGNLSIDSYGGYVFNSGSINITNGSASIGGYNDNPSGYSMFCNYGTVDASGGTTSVAGYTTPGSYELPPGPAIGNYGTITASSGAAVSLNIFSDYAGTLSNNGTVDVNGGEITINASNSAGSYISNSGIINGSGSVNLDGTTNNSGTLSSGSGQTLTISTDGYSFTNIGTLQTTGNGNVDINGSVFGISNSWTDQNIGSTPATGIASYSAGGKTWTLGSDGSGTNGSSDQFNYDYQSWNGNGALSAEVSSESLSGAAGGVMFRDSSATGAAFASIALSPGTGVEFQYRNSTNGTMQTATISGISGPVWVELARSGSSGKSISAYYSTNGTTWTQIGSTQTINFSGSTIQAGMAATGHAGQTNIATFINEVITNNLAPLVLTAAAANPSPVTGTTTSLSVAGETTDGENNNTLTYTWSVTSKPSGAATPTFSANGTDAAENTTATFRMAGNYTFLVTITDPSNSDSTTNSVTITVNQTLGSVTVSPTSASLDLLQSNQFSATAFDQFGIAMATQPTFTWSVLTGGVGSISNSGLYSSSVSSGSATVKATVNGISGTASVTVNEILSDATLNQNLTVPYGSTLTIENGLTINSGVMLTADAGSTIDFTSTSQTVSGSGQIILNAAGNGYGAAQIVVNRPDVLTLASGITVSGAGSIGGTGSISNRGVIDADLSSQHLNISVSVLTNTGTLEAIDGGYLSMGSGVALDAGGTLMIASGSTGYLSTYKPNIGTINVNGGNLMIFGGFTNAETININNNGYLLCDGSSAYFTNAGTINVNDGTFTVNNSGGSGSYHELITNTGTITVNQEGSAYLGDVQTYPGSSGGGYSVFYNAGTINANGGYISIGAYIGAPNVNLSGFNTFMNFGAIPLLNNGTMETNNEGNIRIVTGGSYNDIVANGGTIDVNSGNVWVNTGGYNQMFNSNTINVAGGSLYIGGYTSNASGYSYFTNYGTIDATGGTTSIAGYSTPYNTSAPTGPSIVNDGTITVSDGASVNLTIFSNYAGAVVNDGTMFVDGGNLTSSGSYQYQFINSYSGYLGTYGGGTVRIGVYNGNSAGYSLFTNYGFISNSGGATISIAGYVSNSAPAGPAIANIGEIYMNSGSVSLDILGNAAGTVANNGVIYMYGGQLTSSGSYQYQFINSYGGFIQTSDATLSIGGYNGDSLGYSLFANDGTIDAYGGMVSIAGYLTTSSANSPGNPVIVNNGTLTANDGASVTLNILGGNVLPGNNIINNGTMIARGGGIAISSGRNSTVLNNGTIEVTSNNFTINTTGGYNQMVNSSSGVIDVIGATLSIGGYFGAGATGYSDFTNYGTIDVTGNVENGITSDGTISIAGYATGSSAFSGAGGPAITNNGTITVGSAGSISLNIMGHYAGTVSNDGTININGGKFTSSGSYEYKFVNSESGQINANGAVVSIGGYKGNASGYSVFANYGTIDATGATISISGYLTPNSIGGSGSGASAPPSNPIIFNDGTITAGSGGTISIDILSAYASNISNAGTINANGGNIILNASTASGSYAANHGTISAENSGEINVEVPGSNDFINTGSATTASGGVIHIYTVINYDDATLTSNLTVLAGDMLMIENGLSINSGVTLTVDAGAVIDFADNQSQSISGNGQIVLDAGGDGLDPALLNVGISDALSVSTGITLDDAGTINTFNGSNLNIQGILNLESTGQLNMVNGSSGYIGIANNSTWTDYGTITINSGSLAVNSGKYSMFINNGLIDLNSGSFAINTSGAGYNQFINSSSGVIDVNGGTLSEGGYFNHGPYGNSNSPYSYFTNDGTIDATGGTTSFSGSGYGTGAFVTNNGNIIATNGAAVSLSVEGYVNYGGSFLNSDTGVIDADGGMISLGGYNGENSLYTTFINYGKLEASSPGGSLSVVSSHVNLEASGSMTVAGEASEHVYISNNEFNSCTINNAGLVSGAGQVNLDGVTTNSGTFEAGAGQALIISTGGYNLTNTGVLETTTTGTININGNTFGTNVSWTDQNIGNSPATGAASYNSSTETWTLGSSGTGTSGSSDQFNYAYQNWTGNGTLIAEVNSESLNSGSAGVMFRDSSAAGAIFASVALSPANGVEFEYRTTTNGTMQTASTSGVTGPIWVEIERSGNGSGGYNISGYYSTNDTTWTQIGATQTLNFSNNTIQAGLAAAGNGNSNTATISSYATYYTVPPEIQASYATIPNEVQLNWNTVNGATSYTLWRSATDIANSATVLASGLTGTSYLDSTASTTNVDYYWVTAVYGSQTGGYGGPAEGLAELAAPGNVTATNNLFNEIQVAWNAVAGTTRYTVFRNTSNSFSGATELASGVTGTSFTDTSATNGITYYYWIQANNTLQNGVIGGPAAGATEYILSGAYDPYEIREAYQFNQLSFTNSLGQSVTADGAGQTIAIVDAYDDYTIFSDLDTFDQTMSFDNQSSLYQEFGPASSFLTQKNMSTQFPGLYPYISWATETSLDVEWAHAIAPAAQIILVEAQNDSFGALMDAVNYAKSIPSVDVISMSWGGREFPSESGYDSVFTTPAGHQGITFVASAGDTGGFTEYPAVSPNVLSVGGTTLNITSNGNWYGESAWGDGVIGDEGGGGGLSQYESQPTYQSGVEPSSSALATPDVSYDANPSTGFSVVTTIPFYGIGTNWSEIGGTSAGAPQWAALIAIADQGRELAGKTSLDGPSQLLPALFNLYSTPNYDLDFHDITTGSNGYPAGSGFDLATGLGSPIVNNLIPYLVSLSDATPPSGSGSGGQNGSQSPNETFQADPIINTAVAENITQINSLSPDQAAVSVQPTDTIAPPIAHRTIHLAAPTPTTTQGAIGGLGLSYFFNPLDQLQFGPIEG